MHLWQKMFFLVGLHEFMIYLKIVPMCFFQYTLADNNFWHLHLGTNKTFLPVIGVYLGCIHTRIVLKLGDVADPLLLPKHALYGLFLFSK